jgi:hypothetical protein
MEENGSLVCELPLEILWKIERILEELTSGPDDDRSLAQISPLLRLIATAPSQFVLLAGGARFVQPNLPEKLAITNPMHGTVLLDLRGTEQQNLRGWALSTLAYINTGLSSYQYSFTARSVQLSTCDFLALARVLAERWQAAHVKSLQCNLRTRQRYIH